MFLNWRRAKSFIMSILALDPSGTTETGYFLFRSSQDWIIGTITGKTAVEQSKNLNNLLKKERPQNLVWETSFWWKTNKAQKDLQELVYFNGIILYLADINNISGHKILNNEIQRVIKYYDGEIGGLVVEDKKWYFQKQPLTIHQRDALLVFFVYWTIKLKRPWPWI